jgi:hypothetical protein
MKWIGYLLALGVALAWLVDRREFRQECAESQDQLNKLQTRLQRLESERKMFMSRPLSPAGLPPDFPPVMTNVPPRMPFPGQPANVPPDVMMRPSSGPKEMPLPSMPPPQQKPVPGEPPRMPGT